MEIEEQVPCSNCNKPQGVSRVHLHEAYCLRNIRKCPDCDEFIDKRELDKHKEEVHTSKPCKYCKAPCQPNLLEIHEKTECQRKPERCAYCTLDVPSVDYAEYISQCGARTKECFLCSKNIILFNYDNHMETCVGEQPYEQQFPSHQQLLGGIQAQNQPKPSKNPVFGVPQYNPTVPQRAARVQIGAPGAASIITNSNSNASNLHDEFTRRMKLATQNNDEAEMKRLQEEEDERLAHEMMKDFSPKQKTENKPFTAAKDTNNFNDYDYEEDDYNDIDEHAYDEDDDNNDHANGFLKPQTTVNTNTIVPEASQQKSAAVKELEDMGEFCEDPELQEAIMQSQQFK